MLGPTVAWRSQRNPFVEFAIDVGGWAGGRDEGLDAGYYLGVRSFFGLQVSDTAAIGLRLGAGLYGGARDWLTFQPGLALRWSLEQGP